MDRPFDDSLDAAGRGAGIVHAGLTLGCGVLGVGLHSHERLAVRLVELLGVVKFGFQAGDAGGLEASREGQGDAGPGEDAGQHPITVFR